MTRTTCFMTSRKDNKIVKISDYKATKELNHYVRTHLDMERAWQYACNLIDTIEMKNLDPVNVRLSLYKLMVLKLQNDGYDYHSLRRILQKAFDEDK